MIRPRLFSLLREVNENNKLGSDDIQQIKRSTLLYCMGRQNAADFRSLGKGLGIVEPLYDFKTSFLDRTHYTISLFWRAAFAYFRYLDCGAAGPDAIWVDQATVQRAIGHVTALNTPELRDGCAEDLGLMEDCLAVEDQRKLFRLARSARYQDLDSHDFYSLTKDLHRYAAGITYQSARFLTRNDYGLSLIDLQNEVFEAGLRTMYQYDSDDDRLRLLNTAKRGAFNHMIIMLEHHTAKRRRRLARVTEPPKIAVQACGTCDWFDCKVNGVSCRDRGALPNNTKCSNRSLAYKPHRYTEQENCVNCRFYDTAHELAKKSCLQLNQDPRGHVCEAFSFKAVQLGEFSQTLTSLDRPLTAGHDATPLIDMIENGQATQEDQVAHKQWFTDFYNASDGKTKRLTRIVMGDGDPEFEQWLMADAGKQPDDLPRTALARKACQFLGLSLGQLRRDLREISAA